MTFLNKEEYLKLIEEAYANEDDMEDYDIYDSSWIPSESPAKARMERARAAGNQGVIDVLKYKKEQIRDALYQNANFQVGEFLIHVEEYHGLPSIKKMPPNAQLTMDIAVMQEKNRTPSGAPCKMTYKMDFFKDNRFTSKSWISYFNSSGKAHNIPVETVVDIIRWMQALKNLTCFL
jgi:hypothetical protein